MQSRGKKYKMATNNDEDFRDTRDTLDLANLPSHEERNLSLAGTYREQSDVLRGDNAYSFQYPQASSGHSVSRSNVGLETTPDSLSFSPQMHVPVIPWTSARNNHSWVPYYYPWSQQAACEPYGHFVTPLQTIGVPPVENYLPTGEMPEQHGIHRGNRSPVINSRPYPVESIRPGNGAVPRPIGKDTLMLNHGATSPWTLGSTTPISQEGSRQHLQPVPGASGLSTNNPESVSHVGTKTGNLSSQKQIWHHLDNSRDNNPTIPPKTKYRRRKMTQEEKDDTKALKLAGGACHNCRKKKKKCLHRILGRVEQTSSSVSRSSIINNPRQSSGNRTVFSWQNSVHLQDRTAGPSSYQQPSGSGPSVFTATRSAAAPSDATSIDDDSGGTRLQRGVNFGLDAAFFGHQFTEQPLQPPEQLDALYLDSLLYSWQQ